MDKKNHRAVATATLVLTAVIWGSGFMANQMAIDAGFSPGLILLLRFLIATAALLVIFRKKLFPMTKTELRYGFVAGIFMFSAFYAQTLGLTLTSPSNNGFYTALNVLMVPFIAWGFWKRKPPLKVFLSCALCLVGMFVLSYSGGSFSFNLGDLLTVLCAFLFACHIAYLGVCASRMEASKLTFLQMAFSLAFSLVAFLIFDIPRVAEADFSAGLLPILYIGLFSTCLCFFLQTFAQSRTNSGTAAVILCTESLWCAMFSVLLGYESATVHMALGGLIILVSVVCVETDFKALFRKQNIT